MRVRAHLHGFAEKTREVDLPADATADTLLDQLGIERELVLVFRGDAPLPGDETLEDGDELRVLRIVSGGTERGGTVIYGKGVLGGGPDALGHETAPVV